MGRMTYEVSRALAGSTPFYPDKQLVVLSHTHTGGTVSKRGRGDIGARPASAARRRNLDCWRRLGEGTAGS